MIPNHFTDEWGITVASWIYRWQIEQDLIISQIICELYDDDFFCKKVAIHGGTAINKLLYEKPYKFSEDIDLVEVHAERIGPVLNKINEIIAPWLGEYFYDHSQSSAFNF
ncbi:MAG: nucleotidyl transferase AbiEii/AbiGii toxin family protein [Desulfovibrio sp.]|jgi:predicted nucleotidyltransferase component of viral defense system|nr:nucleotidyl transferase AbiEii/AbiGii toxin family protein [Desulfovibrio sp.]